MMKKWVLFAIICLLSWNSLFSAEINSNAVGDSININQQPTDIYVTSCICDTLSSVKRDSLVVNPKPSFRYTMNRIYKSAPFKMTCAGVPLIITGLAVKSGDKRIRGLRNEYAPEFNNIFDDYSQYLPGALLLGLKVGGVKSRSSWGRMIVSDAFSAALMAGAVNVIKHSAKVTRPDGSNDRSFPSGHTATAFMFATMLHKEYGNVSPWYSVAGYTMATYTGVSRILNNKHWLSDVFVGAGIGILATELGYFLADVIFKEKGINSFIDNNDFDIDHKPSYLGVYLGVNLATSDTYLANGAKISLENGANAGIEGAYFFNKNFGVGGRFSFSDYPVIIRNASEGKMLSMVATNIGPFFSIPIIPQLLIGGNIVTGYSRFSKCEFTEATLGDTGSMNFGTGVSFSLLPSKSFNVKFVADYNLCGSYIKGSSKSTSYLTLGGVAAINF